MPRADNTKIGERPRHNATKKASQGVNFRPEYLKLGELREVVDAPMMALTATATLRVLEEIQTRLHLVQPEIVRGDFSRDNLRFAVDHPRTQADRLDALERALVDAGLRSRRGGGGGRAIVYCSTRKKTETVAKALKERGHPVGYYHAGRTQLARERAHRAFQAGRTRILVATNAFGMGIDFPDVRLIVHFQAPGSLEAYYQEAGRAGRDGAPATCLMYFSPADLVVQRRLEHANASELMQQRRQQALEAVENYAHEITCRQQVLVRYFTPDDVPPRCGRCDVCDDAEAVRATLEERLGPARELTPLDTDDLDRIVQAVDRLRRPVGRKNLAQALRGGKAKSLSRGGLLTLPEYGTLRRYDEASVVAAIDDLLRQGRLQKTGRKYPTVWIPGKPVRAPAKTPEPDAKPRRAPRAKPGQVVRALDNYRKRMARKLKWKPYMVMQKRVMTAIDKKPPQTMEDLLRIPGLGPAKVERFGEDILEIVRQHC